MGKIPMAVSKANSMTSAQRRRWVIIALSAVLTAAIALMHAAESNTIRQLTNLTFDTYQRISPRPYEEAAVTIVNIDEASLARFGQWPWPRTRIAELVDRLNTAGAAAIVFDIVFAEPDRTSPRLLAPIIASNPSANRSYDELVSFTDHDEILAQAIEKAPVVDGVIASPSATDHIPPTKAGLVYSGTPPTGMLTQFTGVISSLPKLNEVSKGTGTISLLGDADRIVRRIQLFAKVEDQLIPSLSLEALRIAQGARSLIIKSSDASGEASGGTAPVFTSVKVGQFEIPTNEKGEVWLYHTKPKPSRHTSASWVLDPDTNLQALNDKFDGRIVFVGAGAAGLRDVVATPLTPYEVGVTVHASFVEQILLGKHLVRPDWATGFERIMILAIAALITASVLFAGAVWTGALTTLIVTGLFAYSWNAFSNSGFLVDPVFPVLSAIGLFSVLTGYRFFQTEQEKTEVRHAFGQYLSPVLVEKIADDPSILTLGGEERELTVLIADIRNFTRISEHLSPEELTSLLNGFLTPVTDTLLQHGATIDKYVGDSVMAFWNAPLDTLAHEEKALQAARAILEDLAIRTATSNSATDPFAHLRIGIGINTGPCCVGNLGSDARFSYSAIGDTVNLTSRLESLTKQYHVQTIVGERTLSGLPEENTFELDWIRVVGRENPETISTPLYRPPSLAADTWDHIRETHKTMLAAYRNQEWQEAEALIEDLLTHEAITAYLGDYYTLLSARITAFRKTPPGDDWDGVFQAETK